MSNSQKADMKKPILLSIVAPLYNEEENVRLLAERTRDALADFDGQFEIILVDDGSRDNTATQLLDVAKDMPEVKPLLLARNYGQSTAMQAGLEAAEGHLIATMDGDLQNDPTDIPRMARLVISEGVDVVSGRRASRQDGSIRKSFSRMANWMIRRATGIVERDFGCSLRVYRREIIERIRVTGELHRFIPALLQEVGAEVIETDVKHHARQFGTSKYSLDRTFRVALDILLIVFLRKYIQRPLHAFGGAGLLCLLPGSLIMAYLAGIKIFLGDDIGGRPLLLLGAILILTGVTLIGQGLIGELMTRQMMESGSRPQYRLKAGRPDIVLPPESSTQSSKPSTQDS